MRASLHLLLPPLPQGESEGAAAALVEEREAAAGLRAQLAEAQRAVERAEAVACSSQVRTRCVRQEVGVGGERKSGQGESEGAAAALVKGA